MYKICKKVDPKLQFCIFLQIGLECSQKEMSEKRSQDDFEEILTLP